MWNHELRQQQIAAACGDTMRNPIRDSPMLYNPQVAYFKSDSYELFRELCHMLGIYYFLSTEYLPLLTESRDPWNDRFCRHLRVVGIRDLVEELKIPKKKADRFPEQCQLSWLLHHFVEDEDRNRNANKFGYPPHVPHVKDVTRRWEPNVAFALINNGPFIDIMSQPVLTPKRV